MPSSKLDPYAAQISTNIFKLTNTTPIPFEITSIFSSFDQVALLRFFEQHQTLGVDIAPFVFGMLVHAAVMLDEVELYNPDHTGSITSMNLFINLIGESGTNKSGLFRVFNNSINALQKIFPSFFSKPVVEITNEKEILTTSDLIANNETELSLFQRLSKRENVFISSDELDVINTRFGVYQGGSTDNDMKTIASKLLCQGYDIMKNVSRTTGSSSYFIKRGSINIFGASTGNMLSSVCRQYNSNTTSDGTISRYLFITTSVHKTSNDIPSEILSVQPNIVHVLVVLRLLAQYKPIFVFGEHQSPPNLPKLIIVPPDIEEARKNISNPISPTEPISNLKPKVIVDIKEADKEQDGSIISAYNAIRRVMEAEHQKSLQCDAKGSPIYTPLQRAFQRKSSNKLARLAGLCQAISYAIQLCSECVNIVRFGDGLYLKEYIDDEQINWLMRFHDNVKVLIERDIAMAPKYGTDQRPLIVIEKAAVHASNMLYQYNSSTISALFDGTAIDNYETTKNNNNISINNGLSNNVYYEHHSILLKMTSPILVKAWFNNEITGLPFTKIFCNYRKSKSKVSKLIETIDELVQHGILKKGVNDNRHVVAARKETYLKTSPVTIRANNRMLDYLQSIGIDIDTYEHAYLSSPLPMNMELTTFAVNLILSDDDYIEYCHLFNDVHIQNEMGERLSKQMVEYRMVFGQKQYYIPSLSQIVEEDNLIIENSQRYDGDQTPTNNNDNNDDNSGDNQSDNNDNALSTLLFVSHRSITNPSPNTISSRSANSSLFTELLNMNNNNESQNNNVTDQITESNNRLQNEILPSVDDITYQMTNMLDYDAINVEQLDSTTNTNNNNLDNPTSSYRNESTTNNREQNQNRSVLANIELLYGNNNNNNVILPTESTSNDTATVVENMSSQQTLELISSLLQNKKHLLKRIMAEENNDISPKRSRNNENEEITLPIVDMNLSGSLSSTSAQTQSNNTTDDSQITDKDLQEAYQKIILNDVIIMSQSDICNKLKHIKNISKSRDNIISKLVTDKLLIKGNWFASKKVNGNIDLLPGFLKAFPKNNLQDQLDFARLLAKYNVHFDQYEGSFKKNNIDTFPRTLIAADVKHKTWLYSNVLSDYIRKNDFLNERILLDPSAIAQENNSPPMRTKRDRKPKQRFSPSDNKK
ncbi:unnamed protein product [Rotaria sordida]|uniref:Uncharacterized protein n=2 Tax=Rotaria sordida TaxID=392033 RepID=A0A814Y4F1_9BILA|nr:unnamed protein product [Rotaria sordida]CAF3827607.1 unnamed protein product [Rotaria sordida]